MSLNNLYFYGKPYTVRALNQPISVELQGQGFVTMPLTLLIDLPSLPGDPIDPTQDFGDNGPFSPGIPGVNNPPLAVPQWYLYDHLGNTRSMLTYDCSDDEFFVTFAADYYPYGKTLWEYHLTHLDGKPLEPGYEENARYMSTQHERDKQTNFDFRGARYYDSNIGRFLSVDPLAADFTAWSPYNYVLGNPVRFVDPDGRAPTDNIVYVLMLNGANAEQTMKSVSYANSYFQQLGMKTTVVMKNADGFDISRIDNTDAVAIVGGNKNEVSDYFRSNILGETSEIMDNLLQAYSEATMEQNPESTFKEFKTVLTSTDNSAYASSMNQSPEEALGLVIVHGAGHVAGITHNGAGALAGFDYGFMGNGNLLQRDLIGMNSVEGFNVSPYLTVSNLMKGTAKEFPRTVSVMKKYFEPDNQESCDNYGCN